MDLDLGQEKNGEANIKKKIRCKTFVLQRNYLYSKLKINQNQKQKSISRSANMTVKINNLLNQNIKVQ